MLAWVKSRWRGGRTATGRKDMWRKVWRGCYRHIIQWVAAISIWAHHLKNGNLEFLVSAASEWAVAEPQMWNIAFRCHSMPVLLWENQLGM